MVENMKEKMETITKEEMIKYFTPYITKPLFYVSRVTGKKYPYYHPNYNLHPKDTIRYGNFGDGRKERYIHDLPKDEYPYELEYDDPKNYIPKWLK